jgi:hypothetical protein
MSKVNGDNNTMASLIPEFYYDLIARVLPGASIAFVYGWLGPDQAANFGTISLAAFLCYVLGLTLDALTDRLFLWARPLTRHINFLRVEDDDTLWSWTRSLPTVEQIPLKKMFAEKILFRVLTFASLVSLVVPPPVLQGNRYRIAISLAFSALFLLCYITLYYWVSYIKRDYEQRNTKA